MASLRDRTIKDFAVRPERKSSGCRNLEGARMDLNSTVPFIRSPNRRWCFSFAMEDMGQLCGLVPGRDSFCVSPNEPGHGPRYRIQGAAL